MDDEIGMVPYDDVVLIFRNGGKTLKLKTLNKSELRFESCTSRR
jgi:hypothetical protein